MTQDGFDYIVVGSGAGGAPLAARLAEAGKRVLVLEAGADHLRQAGEAAEVSQVPGFHGLSTEHPELSWEFFVKHYGTLPHGVARDPKCHPQDRDPEKPPPEGIFYPRSSGVGGCTVHNAMITIAGPDSDWEDLADFVGDDSWRGAPMRAYFQKLERNQYLSPPKPGPIGFWRNLWDSLKWLFGFNPDRSRGRHGFRGWLRTSFTDLSLGLGDKQLTKMLAAALWESRRSGLGRAWRSLVWMFLKGRGWAALDPNHAQTQAQSPEGVVLVPLAVCGTRTPLEPDPAQPGIRRGHRSSPRERLLETAAARPNLVIWTDVLVTSVLFAPGEPPRAIGVQFQRGSNLYNAVPSTRRSQKPGEEGRVFVGQGGEVVLSGGAFNTPQLLMLSGIGDETHLRDIAGASDACVLRGEDGAPLRGADGAPRRVHLPGVGRNLQDRYEVTLISEMARPFQLLDGATFALPGGSVEPDRHLKEWRAEGRGLYTSNGAVLGIFKRSNPDLEQPDLFIFGLPLPFYGYDRGYSGLGNEHARFTWALLKGHTQNTDGTVRLRSRDPRDTPDINFNYFNETSCPGQSERDPDLEALVDGVKFVRRITDRVSSPFKLPLTLRPIVKREIHPGTTLVPEGDDAKMRDWIRSQAWGHHACGTCRMGPAGDDRAVLDSRFRVRGVAGLRVVDASIFPKIPGYFIVTNIYMASEKAADVMIRDAASAQPAFSPYPPELRTREASAINRRRIAVAAGPTPAPVENGQWRGDVTGLALSGGGVRSATFNLGVLQALARAHWLRRVDLLSTVSGGGYIGAFLGTWFNRLRPATWAGGQLPQHDVAGRIERELNDPGSPGLRWLRRHGNYLAPTGDGDTRVNVAVFLRNAMSVHFVLGVFVFVLFGAGDIFRYFVLDPASAGASLLFGVGSSDLPVGWLLHTLLGVFYSPWFLLFELALLLLVVPRMAGYWIVSQDRDGRFSGPPLAALLLLSGTLLVAGLNNGPHWPLLLISVALLLSFLQVEMAWRRGQIRELAIGRGNIATSRLRTRNYLTYDLGVALSIAGGAFVFAIVDTLGHGLQQYAAGNQRYVEAFLALAAAVTALMPLGRMAANALSRERKGPPSTLRRLARQELMAGAMAAVLFIVPLVLVSFAAHAAFGGGRTRLLGVGVTLLALLLTAIFAHRKALAFVNRSSLAQTYAARLARAYLGATNPIRFRPQGADVTEVVAGDDIGSIVDYQPFETGGPLHLINMTVNQTVDFNSQRGNRDRKGENVAVSPLGMSIGRHAHAQWDVRDDADADAAVTHRARLWPIGHLEGTDHPLLDENGEPAPHVEMLSLRQWMAVSGAAIGPGRGATTKLGTALLFGLANLRTGHWWNSGIRATARDGFPEISFLGRAAHVAAGIFRTQALLLSEWVARFPGPWDRYWYLSDGGFFEVLGAYELIRRRVPRIIVCDASADPAYEMDSLANLMRKVRIDFAASIEPFTEAELDAAAIPVAVRERLGTLDDLAPAADGAPSKRHAALFWVRYANPPGRASVLLYVKASLTGDESADVKHYRATHQEFPHEGTADQFFDEEQWESYRCLGQHILTPLCGADAGKTWFWDIPLEGASHA